MEPALNFHSLQKWYASQGTTYPWSGGNAYGVWISETMLQQTVVGFVKSRFVEWMNHFPTMESLASSTEEEVLRHWEGLGYYSRAKNLRKAALRMSSDGYSSPPKDKDYLLTLPGIGAYTAGAILSLAYGLAERALDANIKRIFLRIFGTLGSDNLSPLALEKYDSLLGTGEPGLVNSALMQFGQKICLPRDPKCSLCPFSLECSANLKGLVDSIPTKKKRKLTLLESQLYVLVREGTVLVRSSGDSGLFSGLWLFPFFENNEMEGRDFFPLLDQASLEVLGSFTHTYTHFKNRLKAYLLYDSPQWEPEKNHRWVSFSQLSDLPMPSVHRKIWREAKKLFSHSIKNITK